MQKIILDITLRIGIATVLIAIGGAIFGARITFFSGMFMIAVATATSYLIDFIQSAPWNKVWKR
jgi:hypothetical protein